jgi:hypothetical protein
MNRDGTDESWASKSPKTWKNKRDKTRTKRTPQKQKFHGKLKMVPPWLKYPEIEYMDIMWRMGSGEDYMHAFFSNIEPLTSKERHWYFQDFPPPPQWEDWVDYVIGRCERSPSPSEDTQQETLGASIIRHIKYNGY